MRVITAVEPQRFASGELVVFLAGSIEMGAAPPWQHDVIQALADRQGVLLDPRRAAWDSSWEQTIANPLFREQVLWELDGLDRAQHIAMYLAPETRAPITLLELGLHAASGKLLVCCPAGYYRRGNVEIVCERYRVPLLADLAELIAALRDRLPPGSSSGDR